MRVARLLPAKPGGVFERCLKKLAKSYPAVADDVQKELAQLVGPNALPVPCSPRVVAVPFLGRDVLKVRVGSSDQKKGKSGGFRVLLAMKADDEWQPIAVYAKADREDIPRTEILEMIESETAEEAPEEAPATDEEPAPTPEPAPTAG